MDLSTQRPPNGAVYGEVRIGRVSRHRQHTHTVVSHQTPNLRGHGGRRQHLQTTRNFAQFSCATLYPFAFCDDAGTAVRQRGARQGAKWRSQ